jgi:hypothetical protein
MANGRVAVCELSAEREGKRAAARREKSGPPPAREPTGDGARTGLRGEGRRVRNPGRRTSQLTPSAATHHRRSRPAAAPWSTGSKGQDPAPGCDSSWRRRRRAAGWTPVLKTPSAASDRLMRRQLNGTSCTRYFFAELDRVLLVVVFLAPARRPRGAVVLPVVVALCSFPMSFATVLLRLRRFLRESLRVLSRSLTRSRPPRPSSLRRSLSAPSAASIDLSRRSSARGPRVVVLERDVLLAGVLLLRAVERLAWAILGLPLLAYPAAKPTSKRVRSLRPRKETVAYTDRAEALEAAGLTHQRRVARKDRRRASLRRA